MKNINVFSRDLEKTITIVSWVITIIITVLAVQIALAQWAANDKYEALSTKVDSKYESIDSKIDQINSNINSKFDIIKQRLDDQDRYIDAKTEKN